MNVKAGSVLEHRSRFSHPGLMVLTLEDSPGRHQKMTRVMVLCSEMNDSFWADGKVMLWKLTPENWRKIV